MQLMAIGSIGQAHRAADQMLTILNFVPQMTFGSTPGQGIDHKISRGGLFVVGDHGKTYNPQTHNP